MFIGDMYEKEKFYEKCLEEAAKILDNLRAEYPKMKLLFHWKNLLRYFKYDDKMFESFRSKSFSSQTYKDLYDLLVRFNQRKFMKWLLTKNIESDDKKM